MNTALASGIFVYWFSLTGIFFNAASGALKARSKRFDVFGGAVLAFVTALGGGTLRDVLINTPVVWLQDLNYLYVIVAAAGVVRLLQRDYRLIRVLFIWIDAAGLGLFTSVGLEKGLRFGIHPVYCVLLGVITATFGGVIRDVLCNEEPVLFKPGELYATACVVGGIAYLLTEHLTHMQLSMPVCVLVTMGVRLFSMKTNLSLPQA